MKRVINFSRYRLIMLILSGCLILAGLAGLYIRGGLNLGIDFKGGLTEQIQIVPVAFTVGYNGEGFAELSITDGILNLSIQTPGTSEPEQLSFDFQTYRTIGVLADLLSRIETLEVSVLTNAEASTERILPKETPVAIDETAVSVNILLSAEDEIFASIGRVRETLSDLEKFTIQVIGDPRNQEFIIRAEVDTDDRDFQEKMESRIFNLLGNAFGSESVVLKKSDFVGPRFSQDLAEQSISLTAVALALILIYISIRFRFIYAVAAIIALVHDVAIMLGVFGAFQLEVTTTTIAAVLTIVGYSLNDTIVIFDRVRENSSLLRDSELESIINTSITQSLSRTLITSLTTLLVVVAIFIFGTGEIRAFALALIIGIVTGTYSSIFIASPTILGWQMALERKIRLKEAQKYDVKPEIAKPSPAKAQPGVSATGGSTTRGPAAGEPAAGGPGADEPGADKQKKTAPRPGAKKTQPDIRPASAQQAHERSKKPKRKKKRKKR